MDKLLSALYEHQQNHLQLQHEIEEALNGNMPLEYRWKLFSMYYDGKHRNGDLPFKCLEGKSLELTGYIPITSIIDSVLGALQSQPKIDYITIREKKISVEVIPFIQEELIASRIKTYNT